MARPPKEGLDYFPHDTDASSDEKLQMLEARFGLEGYGFFFKMCEKIYRAPNAKLDISRPESLKILANHCKIRLEKFNKMFQFCKEVELLWEEVEQDRTTVSSSGIQRRAQTVLRQRVNRIQTNGNPPQEIQQITPQEIQQETGESKVNNESKVNIYLKEINNKEKTTPPPQKTTENKEDKNKRIITGEKTPLPLTPEITGQITLISAHNQQRGGGFIPLAHALQPFHDKLATKIAERENEKETQ